MLTQKILTLIITASFLSGCSMAALNKKDRPQRLVITPFWVRDTLAKPNVGFRKVNRMSPVIYKDRVIVGNALDGLVAYDIQSKNQVWRIDIPFGIEASATGVKDRLFVGSNNGKMYSVDLAKGQTVWTFDTKSEIVAEPLLQDGILYFISGSQSVFALDALSGKQVWMYNRQDTANLMTVRGGSRPAYANGIIYLGFSDGSVVSLNAKTGTPQWEMTLNRNTRFKDIDASPVIDGDYVYINSYDDKLYCLSKDKGEIIWKAPWGGFSTPVIMGDKIVTTSSLGDLVVLFKRNGTVAWKTKTQEGLFVDPVLLKGLVVAGESQGKLMFFDSLTGEVKGSFEPGRGVFSKPTVSADRSTLYFISGEGNVYGLQAQFDSKSSVYYLR
ncbi:MAG: PQQ-binding-like beta-propeller repeat protein [Bdellovibrionaceae bacterium]|nr:PQQ-binding-like beta-propeller repeat protein [Bdellovibrio sp.]